MAAPCVISEGTVIEDFSDTAEWSADTMVQALLPHWRCVDDIEKKGVVLRLKYTATDTGWITKTGLSLNLSDLVTLRLDLNNPAMKAGLLYAGDTCLKIEFSSTGVFGTKCMSAYTGTVASGPVRFTIGAGEFTAVGGESWANTMIAMRIGLVLKSGYGVPSHEATDTTNTTTSASMSSLATGYTLADELDDDVNAHIASTTYHRSASSSIDFGGTPNSLATLITKTNLLKTAVVAHCDETTVHKVVDKWLVDFLTSIPTATDQASCQWLLNYVKMIWNTHLPSSSPRTVSPYIMLDKIVKNAQNRPMIALGFDTSISEYFQRDLAIVRAAGILNKCHTTMLDYDNIGDLTYSTWGEIKAAADEGLGILPMETMWLLWSPTNSVRPVPPYLPYDANRIGASDLTFGIYFNPERRRLLWDTVRAIHAHYGLPCDLRFITTHAGVHDDYGNRLVWQQMGVVGAFISGAGWAVSNGPSEWALSLPAPKVREGPIDFQGANVDNSVSLATVKSWVDRAILYGRFCCFDFYSSPASVWSAVDFQELVAYIVAKRDANLLDIVSLEEFAALAAEPTSATLNDRPASLSSVPGRFDLECTAGDELDYLMTLRGHNLTGCSLQFLVSADMKTAHLVEKTTGEGAITLLDASSGEICVSLAAVDTLALRGLYVWQLRVTQGGAESVAQGGVFRVWPAIA